METEAQRGEGHTAQDQLTLPAFVHPTVLDARDSVPQKVLVRAKQNALAYAAQSARLAHPAPPEQDLRKVN